MIVPFSADNGQWYRVTTCHMTMVSHRHNSLPAFVAVCRYFAGCRPMVLQHSSFLQGFRFWTTMVAESPLLSKVAQVTRSPNEPCTFLLYLQSPHTSSKMDFFASLDRVVFAQDPTMSFEPFSTEPTTTTSSSLTPQSGIPIDEDRSDSGYFTTFCVIS